MPPVDWSHLRYILAVARGGGYAEAGRRLNVDPTVVRRRIRAIKSALCFKLFQRALDGRLHPTKACEEVISRAEIVEAQISCLSATVKGLDAQ
ncbi:LysR family transcriptional regulator [Paraburkholderia caledonica]